MLTEKTGVIFETSYTKDAPNRRIREIEPLVGLLMEKIMNEETKTLILACVSDSVIDLLYYDRKEDEDLPRGVIEEAIKNGTITTDEIVETFKKDLIKGLE